MINVSDIIYASRKVIVVSNDISAVLLIHIRGWEKQIGGQPRPVEGWRELNGHLPPALQFFQGRRCRSRIQQQQPAYHFSVHAVYFECHCATTPWNWLQCAENLY